MPSPTLPDPDTVTATPRPAPLSPAEVDRLRAACVAEVRSARAVEGPDSACAHFEAATRRPASVDAPAPRPATGLGGGGGGGSDRAPSATRRPPSGPVPPAASALRDLHSRCTRHPPGSIAYRECRAKVSAWLWDECRRWEQRRDDLRLDAAAHTHAHDQARAWCFEARRYRIVE